MLMDLSFKKKIGLEVCFLVLQILSKPPSLVFFGVHPLNYLIFVNNLIFYCFSLIWGEHTFGGGWGLVADRDWPGWRVDQGEEAQPLPPGPHARGVRPDILYRHHRNVWAATACMIMPGWLARRYQKTRVMKWSMMTVLGNLQALL